LLLIIDWFVGFGGCLFVWVLLLGGVLSAYDLIALLFAVL